MKSIAKIYTDAIKNHEKVLFGNWNPGHPLKLGDFGIMTGNIFVHQGHLSQIAELSSFNIKSRIDDTTDERTFTGGKGVNFGITAKAEINDSNIPIKSNLKIGFEKEEAVFFNAAECLVEMIENKHELGQAVLKLPRDKWKREFVIVTDLIKAKRTLIAVSQEAGFTIEFEADANISNIDLDKANLNLNFKSQKSAGYHFISEQGTTPLIGLSKIQSKFLFFGNDFKPLKIFNNKAMIEISKDNSFIQTEETEEDLYFGQYTSDLI